MALPILLFVMALIVGMGAAANWKVRTLIVARNEAWRHRWPRVDVHGFTNLRPIEWPAAGTASNSFGGNVAELDDPAFEHPVIRGPIANIQVNGNRFDPTRGLLGGAASLRRRPPLLPRIGILEYDVRHPLLDNKWQYHQMGLAGNQVRRLPILYQLDEDQALRAQYDAAVQAILTAPFRPQLAPLDRDDELLAFYGSYPDFHARMSSFCSLDRDLVDRNNVQPLLLRIPGDRDMRGRRRPGVADRMTGTFLRMYQAQQALLDPPSPILAEKIRQLEDFQSWLQTNG